MYRNITQSHVWCFDFILWRKITATSGTFATSVEIITNYYLPLDFNIKKEILELRKGIIFLMSQSALA
jgi:hypothetical protein